jgi:hypothetical protein
MNFRDVVFKVWIEYLSSGNSPLQYPSGYIDRSCLRHTNLGDILRRLDSEGFSLSSKLSYFAYLGETWDFLYW